MLTHIYTHTYIYSHTNTYIHTYNEVSVFSSHTRTNNSFDVFSQLIS